jgi:CRP/FNR family cyclic AMP-dependent transcriptional regulator
VPVINEEKLKAIKSRKVPKSKLLKAPIRVRTRDGKEDEFGDYVMEADKDRIYIKTEEPYPVGTVLTLGMELPGVERPISFRGEVVRINPHKPATPEGLEPGMGIVFERVSYDNRKLISDYLEKIQSEDRSEEYSVFLTWVSKISRPMGPKERERVKKDLLKVLYGAAKETDALFGTKGKKAARELEVLAKIPLFEEMDETEIEEIARRMVKEERRAGDAVFEEGDVGDKMYVIYRGAVDIIKAAGKGPGQILVTLRAGDYFGEMSLIDDAPRSATAMASEDSVLISITKKELVLLLDNSPGIAAKIYKFFVTTLNQRLRETNEKIKSFVTMAQEMSQS